MAPGLESCGAHTLYMSVMDLQPLNIPISMKMIILWIEDSFIFWQVVAILAENDLWFSHSEAQTGLDRLSAEHLA